MYYRIKNGLDAKAVARWMEQEKMDSDVSDRIQEIAEIFDSSYGAARSVHADGGYIILFPTRASYEEMSEALMDLHNIVSEQKEYLDYIGKDGLWCEELYLFTEEALFFVYPQK